MTDYIEDLWGSRYYIMDGCIAVFSRNHFRMNLRIPGVADRLPIPDVRRCNKCIRTMFSMEIYMAWLYDLLGYIENETITYPKRYYKIAPLIRKEIDKYE